MTAYAAELMSNASASLVLAAEHLPDLGYAADSIRSLTVHSAAAELDSTNSSRYLIRINETAVVGVIPQLPGTSRRRLHGLAPTRHRARHPPGWEPQQLRSIKAAGQELPMAAPVTLRHGHVLLQEVQGQYAAAMAAGQRHMDQLFQGLGLQGALPSSSNSSLGAVRHHVRRRLQAACSSSSGSVSSSSSSNQPIVLGSETVDVDCLTASASPDSVAYSLILGSLADTSQAVDSIMSHQNNMLTVLATLNDQQDVIDSGVEAGARAINRDTAAFYQNATEQVGDP